MTRLHGFNVLRLRLLHCLYYSEFSLGNKASNPNATAIMLLWWSKLTRIFTLICVKLLKKYPSILSPPLILFKIFEILYFYEDNRLQQRRGENKRINESTRRRGFIINRPVDFLIDNGSMSSHSRIQKVLSDGVQL